MGYQYILTNTHLDLPTIIEPILMGYQYILTIFHLVQPTIIEPILMDC
jgi:hypothetical protein